jgi:hypothetical protein
MVADSDGDLHCTGCGHVEYQTISPEPSAKDYIARLPADWFKDSSLQTWFPITAMQIEDLQAEVARLKPLSVPSGKYGIAEVLAYLSERCQWLEKERRSGGDYQYLTLKFEECQYIAKCIADTAKRINSLSPEPGGDAARLDWLAAHWYDNTIGRDPDGWFTYGKKTIEKIYAHANLREAIDSAMGIGSTPTKSVEPDDDVEIWPGCEANDTGYHRLDIDGQCQDCDEQVKPRECSVVERESK